MFMICASTSARSNAAKACGVRIQNLFVRDYRTVAAVDRVSFSIERGEMVGYIGPNGAGKSTTIKMLTGILVPSGGEIRINGFVPWRQRRHT